MTRSINTPDSLEECIPEAASGAGSNREAPGASASVTVSVRERPILFSAPMVRALLDGRKTQTRRLVKRTALDWLDDAGFTPEFVADPGNHLSPYGYPGDRLWVRETCRAEELSRPMQTRAATPKERKQFGRTSVVELDDLDGSDGVRYLADSAWRKIENTPAAGDAWSAMFYYRGRGTGRIGNTVPPIHMPRAASRLTLNVTGCRIERLHDISEADARAEGVRPLPGQEADDPSAWWEVEPGQHQARSAPESYRLLFQSINGPDSWAANPWVWVISFEVADASGSEPTKQVGNDIVGAEPNQAQRSAPIHSSGEKT